MKTKIILMFWIIGILFCHAQEPGESSAQWMLNTSELVVGSIVPLQLKVQNIRPPLPKKIPVDGLSIEFGRFSIVSVRNDSIGKIIEFSIAEYTIVAVKPGSYVIPAIHLQGVKQQTITSNELHVTVTDASFPMKLEIHVPETEVFVGQPIAIELKFKAEKELPWKNPQFTIPWLDPESSAWKVVDPCQYKVKFKEKLAQWEKYDREFMIEAADDVVLIQKISGRFREFATQGIEEEQGKQYRFIQFLHLLIPSQPGNLNIPEASLTVWMTDKRQDIQIFSTLEEISSTHSPKGDTSSPPLIHVHSLPPGPQEFSGAVGQYRINTSVEQNSERITLSIQIEGKGYLSESFPLPLQTSHFTVDIQETQTQFRWEEHHLRTSKTWNVLLLPRLKNIEEIPVVSFTYFDPIQREYKTVSQGPWNIQATAQKASPIPGPTSVPPGSQTPPSASKRIEPNQTLWPKYAVYAFIICLAVVCVIFCLWLGYKSVHRLHKAYAEQKTSHRDQKRPVLLQQKLASIQNDSTVFWHDLKEALCDYLRERTQKNCHAHSVSEVKQACQKLPLTPQEQDKIVAVFVQWEKIMFGRFPDDAQIRSRMLQDIKDMNEKKL